MRGKVYSKGVGQIYSGITPACAGKSCPFCRNWSSCWDHPRVCGEKPMQLSSTSAPSGSPPRVRGKGSCGQLTRLLIRITPACAGKRLRLGCRKSETKDHPRVCGEKPRVDCPRLACPGSPPRVRGKASWQQQVSYFLRITPACAGKSRYPA